MIIAWILSIIAIVTNLVINLEHSAALQIRLLTIEQEAHAAFAAAENELNQCEAQLSNTALLDVPTAHDASAACNVTVIDANATGELIRITAVGSAASPKSLYPNLRPAPQSTLESMVYRDKRDHTIKRLSWRVLWSVAQPVQRKAH